MANDLVEKVRAAVSEVSCSFYSMPADVAEEYLHIATACAAIKAVAEWLKADLGTEFCATGERLHIKLLDQLKEPPHE